VAAHCCDRGRSTSTHRRMSSRSADYQDIALRKNTSNMEVRARGVLDPSC